MAPTPRNQLLDQLFALFRDTPHWSIRPLREKIQRPEVYLMDILAKIVFLHKSAEHNGLWDVFKDEEVHLFIQPLNFVNSFGHFICLSSMNTQQCYVG